MSASISASTRPTLYTAPLSMFGMKVEIALREKGVDFERVSVPYSGENGYAPKHPVVLEANPKRQVPVLVHGELQLFDSSQIFEYLEDRWPLPNLWPGDISARALARQLELMADEVYFSQIIKLMGVQEAIEGRYAQEAIAISRAYYVQIEKRLCDKLFLAGDYCFADIAFFMAQIFGERMGAALTDETPRVAEWRTRMAARTTVRETLHPMIDFLDLNERFVPAFIRP